MSFAFRPNARRSFLCAALAAAGLPAKVEEPD